ncbi:galactoside O-acetyltransferase [Orenia metallireducens]|uniref:acyltransferase n=1 Tax=Orenia metallireducens TaxID=1413210 RepID=UPI000D04D6F4|nr:acyltransferase [Orenia metallireducens]PRX35681.1 galactoside O-acetyltransferase [Orenia metallireducens]
MNSFYTREELEQVGFKSLGSNVLISRKASIYTPDQISIGNNVRIDDFSILSGELTIGNYIHVAAFCGLFGKYGIELKDFSGLSSRVTIYSATDDYSGRTLTNPMIPKEYKKIKAGKVVLEKHTIVGASSIILPKVVVREGTSIGAMSLVNKSTEEWKVYFGIPAKILKSRKKNLLDLEKTFLNSQGDINEEI